LSNQQIFRIPDIYTEQQLLNELTTKQALKSEPIISHKLTLYDTFDWRLYNKSLVLYQIKNQLYLRQLDSDEVITHLEIDQPPTFIWDLPDSPLKKWLKPLIKMRALMALTTLYSHVSPYRILNKDEKTVVRLTYQRYSSSAQGDTPPLAQQLLLSPVRGYDKQAQLVRKRFAKQGFEMELQPDIYFKALDAAGKQPGDYSAKLNLALEPDMPSAEATRLIMRFLVGVMHANVDYISQDIDTEFLHDFRVAVRRTRSALSQIKLVFPAETTLQFKQDFRYVGQLSNELRDLDVYLLSESAYQAMVPPVLQADIKPLFDFLRKKRKKALNDVSKSLKSKKYAQILETWEQFLDAPQLHDETAHQANTPIIDLARGRIYKIYRRVVKAGQQILEDTEDEKLHDLRIECKKLRYLMEFFASLFPPKKITTLIKQLKQLQDNLGDFNDFCVQELYLLNISQELPLKNEADRRTLLAIGSLIGLIHAQQVKVKTEFAERFNTFAAPTNKALFKELFRVPKRKETP